VEGVIGWNICSLREAGDWKRVEIGPQEKDKAGKKTRSAHSTSLEDDTGGASRKLDVRD